MPGARGKAAVVFYRSFTLIRYDSAMDSSRQPSLATAFDQLEETILPSLSLLLDSLLETAAAGRPGIDALVHAGELRAIARGLGQVTRQVEAMSDARYAAGVERPRISA
jgi:hypothetical protein